MEFPAQGEKRKHEEDEKATTPSKSMVPRSDGHFSTPVKRRLEYDFWNPEVTSEQTNCLTIVELKRGEYLNRSIQFRVTYTSNLKDSSIGKIFTFHGVDGTGEIAIVSFRDEAEKYKGSIKVNKVYKLETFAVKDESEKFASGTGCKVQVLISSASVLTKEENEDQFPPIPFNFLPIANVKELTVKTKVDIIGVLVKDWELEMTKGGKFQKRDLAITDKSMSTITMTLWGQGAIDFEGVLHSIIAVRKAGVSEYMECKSLNCNYDTLVLVDPSMQEARSMSDWYHEETEKRKIK